MPAKRGSKWTPLQRIRMSSIMRRNRNATTESFAEELIRLYGDDPETLEWVKKHIAELNAANSDGSVALSTATMERQQDFPLLGEATDPDTAVE